MPIPENLPRVDPSRIHTDENGMIVMYDMDGVLLGRSVPMPTDPEWRKRVAARMSEINYRIADKIAAKEAANRAE